MGYRSVLSNSKFLFLWIGQITSQLADRVFIYVLMIVAYTLTRSNLGVSIPMLSFGIPSVLFSSFAGVYVDRLDRKGIMIVSNILRGAIVLLIIPVVSRSLVLTFLVSLLVYTVAQFFAPAEASSIPELVEKKNLIVANSLFMTTWMGASVMGFGLGAPLVNFLGEKATFVIVAVLYFISAGAIFMIPLMFRELHLGVKQHILKDFIAGFEFIRRKIIILFALLKLFIATSAIAVLSLLAITYAKEVLQIGARNFGYLIFSVGFGMFFGMGILNSITKYFSKGIIVILTFIFSSIILLLLSVFNNIYLALILTFFLGIGNIFVTSTIQTILQERIPRGIRGRIFGVQNMLINSAFTLPVLLFGLLGDIYGVKTAIAILGIIVLSTGLSGIFVSKFRKA